MYAKQIDDKGGGGRGGAHPDDTQISDRPVRERADERGGGSRYLDGLQKGTYRATAGCGVVAPPSAKIAMIRLSVNFNFLITSPT
jgi:hypothetical protein